MISVYVKDSWWQQKCEIKIVTQAKFATTDIPATVEELIGQQLAFIYCSHKKLQMLHLQNCWRNVCIIEWVVPYFGFLHYDYRSIFKSPKS